MSDSGENLSPTYAPEMIMPAVIAGLMPRPAPIPRNARPIVAVVVQEEPQARPTIAQRIHPIGRKSFGVSRSSPYTISDGIAPEAMKLDTRKPTVQRIRTASMEALRRSIIPVSISLKLCPQETPTIQATIIESTNGMCASW